MGSCGQTIAPPAPGIEARAATTGVPGDWDDLEASVLVGTSQAECVVVRRKIEEAGVAERFEIKHVSGRTGVLTARRGEDGEIVLVCEMGPLRDPALEALIVDRVRIRLGDLKGKEYAPIRG